MDTRVRTILISAGTFLGVLFVMCLVAKVMMQDTAKASTAYEDALDKLSHNTNGSESGTKDAEPADTNKDSSSKNNSGTADASEGSTDTDTPADSGSSSDGDSSGDRPAEPGSDAQAGADITPTPKPSRHIIVIDAAHQSKYSKETEPVGPGASETSIKGKTGATGVSSGVPEYKVNLAIAKYLRDELEARGYEVLMTRESDDVDMSDATRAKFGNENGEIILHIHCNADDREGIQGIMAFYPSKDNKYAGKYSDACLALCSAVLAGLEAETQAHNWKPIALDTQTALNWTTIPAAHIEVGYLSNREEDERLQTDSYRKTIAIGIADGVDLYFANN